MGETTTAGPSAVIYDIGDVAEIFKSSTRHVNRLADSGRMPRPIHIGRLIRWRKVDIDQWIADGCPSCRPSNKKGL